MDTDRDLAIHAKKYSYAWNYAHENKIVTVDIDETDSSIDEKGQTLSIGKIKKYKSKKLKNKSVSFRLKVKSCYNGNIAFAIKKGQAKYVTVDIWKDIVIGTGYMSTILKRCLSLPQPAAPPPYS